MFFDIIISILTQGLIYGFIAYGVYITYKILDFPDLTVDGSFPLGAAVTAVLILKGVNPFLTVGAAFLCGCLAGLATGIIHVKFNVRDLLAGIITMTGLFSINLKIAGSNLPVPRTFHTVYTMFDMNSSPLLIKKLVISILFVIVFKIILDLYFKTKSGLLLRAVGDNKNLVTTLAKDSGTVKILGLVISNGLVAVAGSLVAQEQRAFSATMGTGQVVFGLAAVIIGTTIFKKFDFVKGTTAAIVGSILYKACIQITILMGLDANLLNLITALLFLVILIVGNAKKGGGENA
ncbi:MAG: ABC transporter permease [Clostridia bacterium]